MTSAHNIIKRTRRLVLLSFTFVIVFILAPFVVIFGWFRKYLFFMYLRGNFPSFDAVMRGVVLFFYLELIVGISLIATRLLGNEHLFDGILVAGMLVAFFAFQYPRMTPPVFCVIFTDKMMDNMSLSKIVKKGNNELIFFAIINLSLIHLKNYACRAQFDKNIELNINPSMLISDSNECIYPIAQYGNGLPPFDAQQIATPICPHEQTGDYEIDFMLSSEATWGTAHSRLTLTVTDDNI